ncbi:MAG: tRNA (uridine(34)/cytosine(34)/5-carboxymethylaminomethyluridine(34)-2'-O)-methyltransferase TrmL [Chlamydiae bacterium CG10_big_fil_rev_8_21_14_0_10_42_34]|nr:MAG: tRNA (uridine(34)/cytosine(34)/5-carboxymethylaminomethyluridine(34)-2'-O)-methyltransferase TrmL [Chlamydiae bacterium CG10_big_fil_rev_8_21_14_0_10_42_34]
MKIILFQPQIPQNTGNIVRTCSVTGTELILVRPLGFSTQSRHLKRAGLDYWEDVSIEEIDDLQAYLEQATDPYFFLSSKGKKNYTQASFSSNSILIFGAETTGLPREYHEKWGEHFYTIPMLPQTRCLNLATSVGIVLYEAIRQTNLPLIS